MIEICLTDVKGMRNTSDDIGVVRSFGRTVTQRFGALDDDFMHRGRPLGHSRVLWEVPRAGCTIRWLRDALDLDPGYLSRILSRLEDDGMVNISADRTDARVRRVSLTSAGRAERQRLDRISDTFASSILAPLTDTQRDDLVAAMRVIERLLIAGGTEIGPVDPEDPDAVACLRAYAAELHERFDGGFDPAASISAEPEELRLPVGVLLLARLQGRPVGCGALKFHGSEPAEIKRMWIAPDARGLGLGRRLLTELEAAAREGGATVARLETNGALTEAIAMYRGAGYREVPAFNEEPYAHHWFEKRLGS